MAIVKLVKVPLVILVVLAATFLFCINISAFSTSQIPLNKGDMLVYHEELVDQVKVGLKWDEFDPKRNDNMYCWYVEKMEDVTVQAGTFKDCFKIVYDTCPDTETEWYYPGIGIIKYEYRHHGTITNETKELVKIFKKRGQYGRN